MGMTPRGLRRLDDGARHEEALERRRAAATARLDLETAVGNGTVVLTIKGHSPRRAPSPDPNGGEQ